MSAKDEASANPALGHGAASGQAADSGHGTGSSYYGHPILAAPVWTREIPWYFFTGGLAGASSGLALGARLTGRPLLARRARLVALAGATASPALLISDLGRPERFLNMLRVFKVSSPMSVGSWMLALSGTAVAAATASDLSGSLPRLGGAADAAAASGGLGLATYTAALVADTAVPVWHEARRELPFVFAGSAAASAGAAAAVLTPVREAGPARRLAVIGAVLEGSASQLMERRLGRELGSPYGEGVAGRYARAAQTLTTGGAALLGVLGRRSRPAATVAGAAMLAGAVCERFAVYKAGFPSAADPLQTVGPQRRRLTERRGQAQLAGP